MKKSWFLAIICALALPMLLAAQTTNTKKKEKTPKTAEERAQKQTDKLTAELGLSASQAKQVYQIKLKQDKEEDALKASGNDKKSKHEAKKDIKTNRDEALKRVLSKEQYNKLLEDRKDKKHG